MSPIFLKDGKLLIRDNKLPTSDKCCCPEYVIFICNSNGMIDSPMDVFLNNNLIGSHIQPDEIGIIDGEFWRTSPDITLAMLDCLECNQCFQDDPWLPAFLMGDPPIPNPAFVPGKEGADLSPFALCKDCIGNGDPAYPTNIRLLPFNIDFVIKNGNNTLDLHFPADSSSYMRLWVIKFSTNPLKVDSIPLSTAIIVDPLPDPSILTFNFNG